MSGSKKKNLFFFFCLFFCFVYSSIAQETKSSKPELFNGPWQVGICIGPDFYYGDLNKYQFGISRSVSFAGGLSVVRQITNVIGARGQLLVGGLNGRKEITYEGNPAVKQFRGAFLEFNINGTINFSNLFSDYKPSRHFFVYGTLGIGFTNWNTREEDMSNGIVYYSTPDPRRWRTAAVIPFGLGAIYQLTDKLNLNLEWTFRMATSDLLDQTVGGFKFDFYDYLSVGVSLNLGVLKKKSQKMLDYPYFSTPALPLQMPVQAPFPEPTRQVVFPANDYNLNDNYVYVVQICAYKKHNYSPTWIRKKYNISQPVIREREGKMSRYITGSYKNIEPAIELRDKLLKKGIHDAFIVAYKDGIRHHTVTAGY